MKERGTWLVPTLYLGEATGATCCPRRPGEGTSHAAEAQSFGWRSAG